MSRIVTQAPRSPVPQEVSTELDRVVERWRQLPLDHALSYAGRVRALVQRLADGVASANGIAPSAVPECGPATLMDQLTVLVYDACVAGLTSTLGSSKPVPSTLGSSKPVPSTLGPSKPAASAAGTSTLADDLARLRRELV